MKRIVVALGGNALGKTPEEQFSLAKETSVSIANLIEEGYEVIIAHGNGPQVGMINLSFEESSKDNNAISKMPLPECGAMSQGYIGFHLQNAIRSELRKRKINKPVATIVTQVEIDKNDEAFKSPTKPIGSFYTKDELHILQNQGYSYVEDSGRGFRRVVASPMPVDIIEKESITTLVNNDNVIITVGGGGIPVYKENNELIPIPAVIDKDLASAKLAELVNADLLIILTAVEKVSINFGKDNQKDLSKLTVDEAKMYINSGEFGKGSMEPKVKAALSFVESKAGRKALIAHLNHAKDSINGKNGTIIG